MPSLILLHANTKCTGSIIEFTLYPCTNDTNGYILMSLAPQKTVADENHNYSSFDMNNKTNVELDFTDICKILQVLRGECESIDEGKGLKNDIENGYQKIMFSHVIEPFCGYVFDVKEQMDGNEKHISFTLTTAEATGFCEAIASSLRLVAFGV